MKFKSAAALVIFTFSLVSCTSTAPPAAAGKPHDLKTWVMSQNRARRNAMAGAFIGALLGAASGGSGEEMWKRAAAGAIAGAAIGFAAGRHQDHIYAARDLAVQQAQYDSSQGYVAKLEAVSFDPPQAKSGETTTLYVRYLVIGPNPAEKIKVRLFRGLKYGDDYILGAGPNDFVVPRGGGIVETTMDVTLPNKAPQGTYGVEALIEDPDGRFPQVVGTNSLAIVASASPRDHATAIAR